MKLSPRYAQKKGANVGHRAFVEQGWLRLGNDRKKCRSLAAARLVMTKAKKPFVMTRQKAEYPIQAKRGLGWATRLLDGPPENCFAQPGSAAPREFAWSHGNTGEQQG
jgi:hypothetical protein